MGLLGRTQRHAETVRAARAIRARKTGRRRDVANDHGDPGPACLQRRSKHYGGGPADCCAGPGGPRPPPSVNAGLPGRRFQAEVLAIC